LHFNLHAGYYGIDLHDDITSAGGMSMSGKVVFHHELPTEFYRLLKHLTSYLSSIAVCAESTFNWYRLADGCVKDKIPFFSLMCSIYKTKLLISAL
jgi:hypothetical protein